MGSLEGRLGRLEARQERSAQSVTAEALRLLSDEDLRALEETLEEAVERGEGDFSDLYATTQEHSRRALAAYFAAIEAVGRGEELPEDPSDTEALDLSIRADAGDEGAKREYEKRGGYRIWKYYRKEKRR